MKLDQLFKLIKKREKATNPEFKQLNPAEQYNAINSRFFHLLTFTSQAQNAWKRKPTEW